MYIRDISWVQLDVTQDSMSKLQNANLERLHFYHPNIKTHLTKKSSNYDIHLLNDIMFSLGYNLVSVENMVSFDRLLYAWGGETFYPIKEAHSLGSFLIKELNINMRGLAHSGSNWLHMLMTSDDNKVIEETLSLQNQLSNGDYVMHDMKKKELLVRVNTFLTWENRNDLINYDGSFYSLFRTVDFALTNLRFV